MGKGVWQAEGIAGAAIEVDKPFKRLDAAGHAAGQFVLHAADDLMLAAVDHGAANLADDGHGAVALTHLEESFDDFLGRAEILAIGAQNTQDKSAGLIPIGGFDIEIQQELGLFATLFEIGNVFEKLGGLGEIALGRKRTSFDDAGAQAVRVNLQGFVGKLIGFSLVAAGQGALGRGDVGVNSLAGLPHGLVEIGQANLNAKIVRLREEKFLQEADSFRLAVILEMDFRELQEERAGLAHDPLLDVKVGQFFERANLFGSELGDAFVNGDSFCEKTVADKNLSESLEVIDGLKSLTLANVKFADGHEGDLIAGLVL